MSSSTPPSTAKKRILIFTPGLSGFSESQVQMGINRFALNRLDWQMGYLDVREADKVHTEEALSWKPDGILAVCRPEQVPALFGIKDAVIVHVDLHLNRLEGVSRVEVDNETCGLRAAAYFLRNRFMNFAVVTSPSHPPFSQARELGFTEALKKKGYRPQRFQLQHWSRKPWYRNPDLDDWLRKLPKPVAVYCVQDLVAHRILEQCHSLGIRVPSEVSVVGTDNHRVLCRSIRPFLSSIPQSLEMAGFRAAELLAEHLEIRSNGDTPPTVCEIIEPGEVVVRQSTSLRAIPDSAIANAANYLHDHALLGGNIDGAAREAGINRRALERGFKRYLGTTPGGYMREIKIEHAKKLLGETDLRMSEIAEACRMSQEHFSTFFRKSTGESPSHYRSRKKNPPSRPKD